MWLGEGLHLGLGTQMVMEIGHSVAISGRQLLP